MAGYLPSPMTAVAASAHAVRNLSTLAATLPNFPPLRAMMIIAPSPVLPGLSRQQPPYQLANVFHAILTHSHEIYELSSRCINMQSKCRGEKVESKIEIGSSEPCLNVKIESQSYALFDVNSPARFRGFAPRQKACWRKPAMPSSSSRSDVRIWERRSPGLSAGASSQPSLIALRSS
jgi:hypothetical protein